MPGMIANMDGGNWLAQPHVAHVLVTGARAWIRNRLGGLGFEPLHIYCYFKGYRPDAQHSGWQKAGQMVCTIRQYVTAQAPRRP
jgi:hypothetical protein